MWTSFGLKQTVIKIWSNLMTVTIVTTQKVILLNHEVTLKAKMKEKLMKKLLGTKIKIFISIKKNIKWLKNPPAASNTKKKNIVVHLPGVKQLARDLKFPIDCWSFFS